MSTMTQTQPQATPNKVKWMYAIGQLGWSVLSGIIQVWLIWFYLGGKITDEATGVVTQQIPGYIDMSPIFLGISLIGVITMIGRLVDAFTDPWIANMSDKSKNLKGRRIPFMKKAMLPFALLTVAVFLPPTAGNFAINTIYLLVVLVLYYIAYTAYVTPYFALTAELGKTQQERMSISTYIALTWFLGYIIASAAGMIYPNLESAFSMDTVTAFRWTIGGLALIGLIFMLFPILGVDERKYCKSDTISNISFKEAIKLTFKNKNFFIFEIFFLAYNIAITVFQTGNVLYVERLLGLPNSYVMVITATTGILAFILYPVVNALSRKMPKKTMLVFAMVILIISYAYCTFLGRYPFPALVQGIIFALIAGVGFAVFGILPNAIVADISTNEEYLTGQNRSGMYFSIHTFMSKLGQSIAMITFSSLVLIETLGDANLGLRLTGVVAAGIGIVALVIFSRFKEVKDLSITEEVK